MNLFRKRAQATLWVLALTVFASGIAAPPATAALVQFTAVRYNWTSGIIPSTLPGLTSTQITGNGDGTGSYFSSGAGADSISGRFQVLSGGASPNGVSLFSGFSEVLSGTGRYAGATGLNAFAGYNAGTGDTVSDYGYVLAPNLEGPDLTRNDSFGTPSAQSPFRDGNVYDASGTRVDVPFADGVPDRTSFPTNRTEPFTLSTMSADNSGNYAGTGPNGNFLQGLYFVPFASRLFDSVVFSGFSVATGGGGEGSIVTGGFGVFAGRGVYRSDIATTGLESVTDYGYLLAQPVPEPASWAMLLGGGALLFRSARRRRSQPAIG